MNSQKENDETKYTIISCPRCNRNEIQIKSKKNNHVYKICTSCREKERKQIIDETRQIIFCEKSPQQTMKDAMRQYLIRPESIRATAARKKRYRDAKWIEQKIKEKIALGLLDDKHDLSDIKTVTRLILQIYGLDEEDIKQLTRTWKKIIRILAQEIIIRRTFVKMERRRKNTKLPYLASLHKQSKYRDIIFMLCK